MSIRTGKILLAAAFLLLSVQEAFNMRRQIDDVTSFVIVLVVTLLVCSLILWSAFKKRDPLYQPSKGRKVFWNVAGGFCALIIVGNILGLGKPPKQTLTVNGLKIPLDACVEGAVRMVDTKAERISLCTCWATALANDSTVSKTYKHELEKGQLDMVIERLQREGTIDLAQLSACMANSKGIRWTDGMLDRVKRDCLTRMKDQGSDCEYDVEKFCDCLTNKVALHSPTFLLDVTPDSVAALTQIQEDCTALSRK